VSNGKALFIIKGDISTKNSIPCILVDIQKKLFIGDSITPKVMNGDYDNYSTSRNIDEKIIYFNGNEELITVDKFRAANVFYIWKLNLDTITWTRTEKTIQFSPKLSHIFFSAEKS
jgi:hypothetical protein